MRRAPWPLAALATIALIAASCNSNGSAENGNTGAAGNSRHHEQRR